VEDTGVGVAPDEIGTLFDPFVQAAGGRQAQEGTGLGLTISREYVHMLGGTLTVQSTEGQGSVFAFDLPVSVLDTEAALRLSARQGRAVGLEPGQPAYRLLIVDDVETSRTLLVRLLRPLGFALREAVSGEEAIELWATWQPHLIFMDMQMPGMSGREAARRIKAAPQGSATEIVAVTTSAFEEGRATLLADRCDDLLRKPFNEQEILEVISRRLGVRYVYDKPPAEGKAPPEQGVLAVQKLAMMEKDLLARLQQATIDLDIEMILSLVDQIRGRQPALANLLAELAHNYKYERLSALIEEALSARQEGSNG
jgi:CheY-like chemotaxis protein